MLAVATTPMPCPVSVVDATDGTLEIGGGNYIGEYICLLELRDRDREGRAVLHGAGHAGLELAVEVPHPRPEEGQQRALLLVAGGRGSRRGARRHQAPRREGATADRSRGARRHAREGPVRHLGPSRILLPSARLVDRRGRQRRRVPNVAEVGRRGSATRMPTATRRSRRGRGFTSPSARSARAPRSGWTAGAWAARMSGGAVRARSSSSRRSCISSSACAITRSLNRGRTAASLDAAVPSACPPVALLLADVARSCLGRCSGCSSRRRRS